jgi:acetyltransferase-like isoleucine patch superfamily enzyme
MKNGLAAALVLSVLPSFLKQPIYRLMGMRIGRGVHIGFGAVLACRSVELADGAHIGAFCLLRCARLRMGARARIDRLVRIAVHTLSMGSQTTISSPNEIAGDQTDPRSVLTMGPASWILPYCFVNVDREIRLGRNVGVGGGSYLFTHGLWLSKLDGFPVSFGEITIGDDVWLPWGCFIMPGVTIGSGCVIGARSVVNKSLPPGVLAAGIPAKIIRDKAKADLTPDDRAAILADITRDYAARGGKEARIDDDGEQVTHRIGGEPILVLHEATTASDAASSPPGTLSVVFGELPAEQAISRPCWSLLDYRSSPIGVLPQAALGWFGHARKTGVRFYPIDEDPV